MPWLWIRNRNDSLGKAAIRTPTPQWRQKSCLGSRDEGCYSDLVRLWIGSTDGFVSAILALGCLLVPRPAVAQFIPLSANPHNILEGSWQSCPEPGGGYTERVYDHVVNGVGQYEVHLGPGREFAIFIGVQDDHRSHSAPANLLKPYRVPMEGTRARQRWEVPELSVAFSVAMAGGSRTDCANWFILLEPLEKTSD
jgi:hypothetical protein